MKTKTVQRRAAPAPRRPAKPGLRKSKGSAPASGAPKQSQRSNRLRPPAAGRAARPATPGAGVLPNSRVRAKLWQLRLYVLDSTPKSQTALANLKQFCKTHLKGRYRITVIDLLKLPHLAKGDQILAIPTVVRQLPKPVRTIIGNLSDTERVLIGLDLRAAE